MASSFFNRVEFTATAGTTADFIVSAAVTGYDTPATRGVSNGTAISYTAQSDDLTQWETGTGTYTSATKKISRAVIRESSGGGSAVNFLAPPTVWLDFHAQDVLGAGGSNTQIQYNNSSVLGGITNLITDGTNITGARFKSTASLDWDNGSGTVDLSFFRDGAGILAQRLGTSAQTLRVYNTFTDASNYERGVFDWTTNSNIMTIGSQKAGTGSSRRVSFVSSSDFIWTINSTSKLAALGSFGFILVAGKALLWTSNGSDPDGGGQVAIQPIDSSNSVIEINNTTQGSLTGCYLHWGGQARVTADFSITTSTALVNVTGLSASLKAGRTYSFNAYLNVAPDAVGGHKYAIGTSDTLTATNIVYQVNSVNNTTNANIINSRQTALGGSIGVASGTSDYTEISGIITVNAAGTLTVQFAQQASNGTSTVLRGSYLIVHDMP